jgi:hypothetical protein
LTYNLGVLIVGNSKICDSQCSDFFPIVVMRLECLLNLFPSDYVFILLYGLLNHTVFFCANIFLMLIFFLSVLEDGHDIQKAVMKLVGRRTVPQVFIHSQHLGGADGRLYWKRLYFLVFI